MLAVWQLQEQALGGSLRVCLSTEKSLRVLGRYRVKQLNRRRLPLLSRLLSLFLRTSLTLPLFADDIL